MKKDNEKETPEKCPACQSSMVTETLRSWICADCGATKESSTSRKKIMSFEDKSIEEMENELLRVNREIDSKGIKHPEYQIILTMKKSIENAIRKKERIRNK